MAPKAMMIGHYTTGLRIRRYRPRRFIRSDSESLDVRTAADALSLDPCEPVERVDGPERRGGVTLVEDESVRLVDVV